MSTYPSYRERGEIDDTFHQIYVPLLKISLNISTVKYIFLLVYSIRSMQEHLALPMYCKDAHAADVCVSASCHWLHRLVMNLPRFMINDGLFAEQCAYLLVLFLIGCSLFLYSVWLMRREFDLKMRYRAILTFPSMFFELIICFLSYYATITAIYEYSDAASKNPKWSSSAFVIFAFLISIFYAVMLVIHFATLYYIMIYPVRPLSIYTVSNANYSTLNYGNFGEAINRRSQHYDEAQFQRQPNEFFGLPMINESFRLSTMNNWQTANDTRSNRSAGRPHSINSYSQIRTWNNTFRSTNTLRSAPRERARDDENDYLELI